MGELHDCFWRERWSDYLKTNYYCKNNSHEIEFETIPKGKILYLCEQRENWAQKEYQQMMLYYNT